MSHYETLDVARDADSATIKRAFRKAASERHPDRNGGDADKMAAANRAYEVLADPERRKRYDETGEDKPQRSIHEEARSGLLELFNAALDKEGNVLAIVRRALDEFTPKAKAQKAQLESKRKRISARLGAVRTKDGAENLVHMLAEQQVRAINRQLEELKRAMKVHAAVYAMLKAYESDEAEEVKPSMRAHSFTFTGL